MGTEAGLWPTAADCIGGTNEGMQARLLLVHSPLIGCGTWEPIARDLAEDEAARARELGWPVRQMLSHHLALLTEPGRVAHEVRQLIGRP
jgi:hypothetical protein